MHIKTIIRSYFTPTRMALKKRQIITGADKDVEKFELSCLAGRNVKWYSQFGKQFAVLFSG